MAKSSKYFDDSYVSNISLFYLPGSARGSRGPEGQNPSGWGLMIHKYISNDLDCSFHCFRIWSSLPSGQQRTFLGTAKNVPRSYSISVAVKTFLLTLRAARLCKLRLQKLRFVLTQSPPYCEAQLSIDELELKFKGLWLDAWVSSLMTHPLLCFLSQSCRIKTCKGGLLFLTLKEEGEEAE